MLRVREVGLTERPTAGALQPKVGVHHLAALTRAKEFVERNLASRIGVEEIAAAAGMSRFHFSRIFQAETGQTPASWLAMRRVQTAAQALREDRLSIKAIAALCGFADVQLFGKVFRRYTGMPPGRYRQTGG